MAFLSPQKIITGLALTPGQKIVDFGCGTGAYIQAAESILTRSGSIYGVDINKQLLEKIHSETTDSNGAPITALWADIGNTFSLPIENNTIDVVIFSNICSLLEDTSHLWIEAKRILKHNGKLLVVDWLADNSIVSPAHYTTQSELEESCKKIGYETIQQIPAGDHHFAFIATK
ncbi:MAG: hypothetical protein RI996_343 [Candidatus Parcubacteria bacterium]|jgi:ubiquinone/menaquinone biosynthesis C-methylase UbiE